MSYNRAYKALSLRRVGLESFIIYVEKKCVQPMHPSVLNFINHQKIKIDKISIKMKELRVRGLVSIA